MTISNVEKSRTEISLSRLLSKCELRGRDNLVQSDWRLEKYVEAASAMLLDLIKSQQSPAQDRINEYTRRIEFLKKLLESQKANSPTERMVAVQLLPRGVNTSSDNFTREIHQKACSKFAADIRSELFDSGSSSHSSSAGKEGQIRRRREEKTTGEDLDAVLKQHQVQQEKATEEMLLLARSLKEQSQLASQIIKKDIETVSRSGNKMEDNKYKLKSASELLEEHNRKAGKCWLWVLQIVVIVVFFNMVLFLKMVK